MTRTAFVRADCSTYNVPGGFCGQAWAIYAFAATVRATGKLEHLELAERLADYYLARLKGRPRAVLGLR